MSPAFAPPRQAVAFALLLTSLFAMPALVARLGWLHRRDVYLSIPVKDGAFPWIQRCIFEDTDDVDIAFVGSSRMWCGIDTPYVQKALTEHLGRKAEVVTFGWSYFGLDAQYIIARDLLDHRRVHTLVAYDDGGVNAPHIYSSHWFRVGENSEALAGLPLAHQLGLYAGSVLGLSRHLLSCVRNNAAAHPGEELAGQLGSEGRRRGYLSTPFVEFDPKGTGTPQDAVLYSPKTRAAFTFTGPEAPPYQFHFARKLARLCKERGTQLVFLHFPGIAERELSTIPERRAWPDLLDAPVNLVGIPGAKLMGGLSAEDVTRIFYDPNHLNQNGRAHFMRLLTPTLVTLYESADKPH